MGVLDVPPAWSRMMIGTVAFPKRLLCYCVSCNLDGHLWSSSRDIIPHIPASRSILWLPMGHKNIDVYIETQPAFQDLDLDARSTIPTSIDIGFQMNATNLAFSILFFFYELGDDLIEFLDFITK